VSITVTVIDGVSGRPAEGVVVTVVGQPAGGQILRLHGFTDAKGEFTCSPVADQQSNGECYIVELDVDAYFASLGMMAGYKQITISVRVFDTRADYRMGTLITPFAHATWSIR
jgi:5-hydroxyisourate hydrolase-like protein (transthyretin family)